MAGICDAISGPQTASDNAKTSKCITLDQIMSLLSSSPASSSLSLPMPTKPRSMSAPSTRRIRFAPLPDPRRSVFITDDGDELPINELPLIPFPQYIEPDTESLASTSTKRSTSGAGDSTSTTPCTSSVSSFNPDSPSYSKEIPLPECPTPNAHQKSMSWADKPRFMLRSLTKRPSSSSGTSSSSSASSSTSTLHPFSRLNLSTPEILTLGTINFFRPTIKRGDASSTPRSPLHLTRWTSSTTSLPKSPNPNTTSFTSPLARTQSVTSTASTVNSRSTSFASLPLSPKSTNTSIRPTTPTTPTRKGKGTRMLNGRVYGHRRPSTSPNANPFANARDEADPEFVEWGYGGMGSVRNSRGVSNGLYSRLQREGTVLGGAGDEMDDGSGMGWVRKRREAREREKREREERERREREAGTANGAGEGEKENAAVARPLATIDETVSPPVTPSSIVPPPPASAATTVTPSTPVAAEPPASEPEKLKGEPEHTAVKPKKESLPVLEDEHILRVATVAPPVHRRHSSHGHNRSRDFDAEEKKVGEKCVNMERPTSEEEESEEEGEVESSEYDPEDEEEEGGEEERRRRTALGAGVEKISRHK